MSIKPGPIRMWFEPGRHWVVLSIILFGIACCLPAFPAIFGGGVLWGWMLLNPLFYFYIPWWANPTFVIAVIASLNRKFRVATVFACIAAALAVGHELLVLSDGMNSFRKHMLPGCLFWITGMQVLACHELWRLWLESKRRRESSEHGDDLPEGPR